MDAATEAALDEILARLRRAGWKERESIKEELMKLAKAAPITASAAPKALATRDSFRSFLEDARKELPLELRWEIDEVLEAIAPPPPVPDKPKEEEQPKGPQRLTAADLNLVYDDPRGLMLYKTKKLPERWFATQVDPRTGQPQTFELQAQEVTQLKTQLTGSPYWVLGTGEAPVK